MPHLQNMPQKIEAYFAFYQLIRAHARSDINHIDLKGLYDKIDLTI
jgi:hypothetical protein